MVVDTHLCVHIYVYIYIYVYIERASMGGWGEGWCSGAQPRLKQGRNNEDLKG